MVLAAAVICHSGCGDDQRNAASTSHGTPAGEISEALLDGWFAATAAPDAMAIHLARRQTAAGEPVTINGRVMGRLHPFVDGRAAFVIGDPELLTPCNEKPDDNCPTPWDVCCDTAEAKREGTATIQIIGDDGRVLPASLHGVNGLVELSTVTITGHVAESSDGDTFIVNASSIHVHQ